MKKSSIVIIGSVTLFAMGIGGGVFYAIKPVTPFDMVTEASSQNTKGLRSMAVRVPERSRTDGDKTRMVPGVPGTGASDAEVCRSFSDGTSMFYDIKQVFVACSAAASKGDPEAMVRTGLMYEQANGTRADYFKAFEWYRLAALLHRLPKAHYHLATLYFNGRGVPQNLQKAQEHFFLAAEAGNPAAQFIVAGMYEDGWGVAQDYVTAYYWFSLAERQKDVLREINPAMNASERLNALDSVMSRHQRSQAEKRLAQSHPHS